MSEKETEKILPALELGNIAERASQTTWETLREWALNFYEENDEDIGTLKTALKYEELKYVRSLSPDMKPHNFNSMFDSWSTSSYSIHCIVNNLYNKFNKTKCLPNSYRSAKSVVLKGIENEVLEHGMGKSACSAACRRITKTNNTRNKKPLNDSSSIYKEDLVLGHLVGYLKHNNNTFPEAFVKKAADVGINIGIIKNEEH